MQARKLQQAGIRSLFACLCALLLCPLMGFGAAVAENPVPFVNQPLVPGAVIPGGPEFVLTVNGTGFVSGATVDWDGTPLTTSFMSVSQLSAVVPASAIATAGTASVTVVNPGTTVASNVVPFAVVTPSANAYFANAPNSPINLGGTLTEPESMTVGDFTHNGKLDVALGMQGSATDGFLSILMGNGDGTFAPLSSSSMDLGVSPAYATVGDFTGNGRLDLAVANYNSNTVSILLNIGNWTFTLAPGSPISVGIQPDAIAVGDFTGDGRLDLAVATGNGVSILMGNGDGTFTPAPGSPINVGLSPVAVSVGDFNGDGKLDLAVANMESNTVSILLGNGNGTFTPGPGSPIGVGRLPDQLAVGDFNGDNKLDLAVAYFGMSTVTVLLGNGDGTFTPISGCCGITDNNSPAQTESMVAGDFTGNGRLDLALVMQTQFSDNAVPVDFLEILLGNSDGTFTPEDFSVVLPNVPFLGMGDFNGDGKPDLVAASNPYDELSVLLQTPPPKSVPNFTVTASASSVSVQPGGTATYPVQVASLNGFLGEVSLSCSGAPPGASCSIPSSGVFLFAGVNASFNVTVSTTAPSVASPGSLGMPPDDYWPSWRWGLLLGLILLVTLAAVLQKTTRARAWTLSRVTVMIIGGVIMVACSGNSSAPPTPTGGTQAGIYTLVVTAISGNISQSVPLKLVVK
ncbi:MAG: FG-GAP repeat domain-containing protein [Gammaproteobacteria bacterium]